MLKFYKVTSDFFIAESVFSFNVYLYDPLREKRLVALNTDSTVTETILDEWADLEGKGAYLQIYYEDLKVFYHETSATEVEVLEHNEFYFRMLKIQEERLKKYQVPSDETFLLRTLVNNIGTSDDYMPLIDRVKNEIMCFPLHESEFISITTELVDKLFKRDIMPVRVAAFAYLIAKQNKITDTEQLANIVVASLLKDLGYGLIQTKMFEDFNELLGEDLYLKHPMLSIYILSKSGYEFPKEVKRLILEQHEQADGSGFPRAKKEDHIRFSSFIINLSDQILMYSCGVINKRKTDLIKTIEMFHKGVSAEGINVNFPQRLLDSLSTLLLNDLEIELAKNQNDK